MITINPNQETHDVKLITRFAPTSVLSLEIYNESTRTVNDLETSYIYQDGELFLTFTFSFKEGDRYQLKLMQADEVIFRGKAIVTNQEAQNYSPTDGVYTYSTI